MTQPPVTSMSDAPYDNGASGPPPPPAKVGVWEDFIDIFHAPSDVFARRENGNFWIPMLVVALLVGIFFTLNAGLLQPMMDAEFRRSIAAAQEANPQVTAEQMATMRGFGETIAKVMAFIGMPIFMFLVGVVLWLSGKVVGATQTFHAALVVAAYSMVPRVLESFVTSVQGLLVAPASLTSRFALSFGPARFMDADSTAPALLALVGRFDLFTIWITVLLAIGLAVTGRIPRSQAAIAAAIVWLVGGLPTILPALMS